MTRYPRFLPDGRRYVKGDGPLPCDTLFLGESPGDDEDNSGRAFVGRTGQLLDTLCERAGWRRGLDMRIDNVLKYKPELYDKDGPILPHEIERDRPRLLEQFAKCRPKLVFAMGAVAMEAVLGPWLRQQGVEPRLDWMWGLAFESSLCLTCGGAHACYSSESTTPHSEDSDLLGLDGGSRFKRVRQGQVQRKAGKSTPRTEGAVTRVSSPPRTSRRPQMREPTLCQPGAHRLRDTGRELPEDVRAYESVQTGASARTCQSIQSAQRLTQEQNRANRVQGLQERYQAPLLECAQRKTQCCASPCPHGFVVVSTFHPAAGFHDPVMAARFWRSLTGLRTARVWEKDTQPVEYRAC